MPSKKEILKDEILQEANERFAVVKHEDGTTSSGYGQNELLDITFEILEHKYNLNFEEMNEGK